MSETLFALDIGTRKVVGIACRYADGVLTVEQYSIFEHASRGMIDGQVQDIDEVTQHAQRVKEDLERKTGRKFKRAAIAFARGMALPGGTRLAGVPSVAAAARGELRRRPGVQVVIVLLDARRGEAYRADYERDPSATTGLREVAPPRLVAGAEAAPTSRETILVIREPVPDPYDVAAVGRERLLSGGENPAAVLPLYLKRSHAEIVFDERVGGAQGLG